MRKIIPYIKLLLAILLLVVSLMASFWEYKVSEPTDNWSKIVTTRSPDGKTTGYQMMVYVDRPIMRSDQTCNTYLRIKNVGEHPLELTTTYVTNRSYANGTLWSEEIGDWKPHLKLLPAEVKDVPYKYAFSVIRHPMRASAIGFYGFQFNGFGVHTNTVTVYVLPSRPFWLVLTALAALAVWRTWLGTMRLQRRSK